MVATYSAGYRCVYWIPDRSLPGTLPAWRIFHRVGTVFGDGSQKVLHSVVSRALPVPDGIIGAFGYFLDVVTGIIGKQGRWKSKPWIVVLFGIAVGPLGFVSVMLVIFQPVLIGAWCTLCITTAVISVVMISPAMDEFLASLQHLKRVKTDGGSAWKAVWGKDPFIEKQN